MRNHYNVKCSFFILLNIIILQCNSKHINAFAPFWPDVKTFVTLEIGSCFFTHSQRDIYVSLLLWNWQPPKHYISSPNNGMDGPEIPSEMTATAVVSSMCCVGLQCLAERSLLKTGDMFQLLNPHLGGHQFHNNMEVEMAVW